MKILETRVIVSQSVIGAVNAVNEYINGRAAEVTDMNVVNFHYIMTVSILFDDEKTRGKSTNEWKPVPTNTGTPVA
jgi:hypothetical protein